ncbi:PLP-dependent aminotransferase family protein [Robbsia andropogonis]|nr:PLP-dependent aminotransferase family protein [Robbsia andropogonis]MCP1119984.1 PLP-dependent aminotransferase family protein [Robbsia andropogonis]MCP1129957.1 PLP-dependent aminotransferase family protein [Robbsia andropogonis]
MKSNAATTMSLENTASGTPSSLASAATAAQHWPLSQRARNLTSSAIREILKVTERPEIISFAGGLPAPATFPVEAMRAAAERVLTNDAVGALQYSPTEGYRPLREWVAAHHSGNGVTIRTEQVLITTGSQQALDLMGKIMLDPGSRALVETPSYLGALQSFSMFEPTFVSVPSDDDGLQPETLTPALTREARLLYTQPNFQNPTARRMPLARRLALAEFARRCGFPVIEDDPYGELYYRDAPLPTLLSMAPDHIVHFGTFSKVLAPGLRVGYVIAPEPLLLKLVQAKQAADLHTPILTQRIVHEAIKGDLLSRHLPDVRTLYRGQCDAMLSALEREMPDGVRWNAPSGGMFVWLTLPGHIDATALLQCAIAERVAFVPGEPFYADGRTDPLASRSMRLCFSTVPPARIDEGIAILGRLIAGWPKP